MHKLLEKLIAAEMCVEKANERLRHAEEAAIATPLPKNLRPAEPKDIIEGGLLWYPAHGEPAEDDDPGVAYWQFIMEVLRPRDPFKAYTADDGCRYGLEGAFVEIEP